MNQTSLAHYLCINLLTVCCYIVLLTCQFLYQPIETVTSGMVLVPRNASSRVQNVDSLLALSCLLLVCTAAKKRLKKKDSCDMIPIVIHLVIKDCFVFVFQSRQRCCVNFLSLQQPF